ncbi:hypothetical protein ABZV80_43580 [Streptomyces sp. NPDC005132]|uniref:hypothetical protein n=1 Tax=Streptomyces sp. NPDC005132 TaxID=3154294 RepID=UPI0033B4DF42
MTTLKHRAASAAIGTLALVCGTLIIGPAQSASAANCRSWGTTDTAADIVGAYTHGEGCTLDSGRVQIDVTIEDTKADGKGACAQLHATYADGGTRDEWVYVAGTGNTLDKTFNYASSVRNIWVREGLGNSGKCTEMAGGTHKVWPK